MMRYNSRKHSINETFFDNLADANVSYILGLMYADGWVTDNYVVGLSLKDEKLVNTVGKLMSSNYPIIPKLDGVHELRATSKLLSNRLISIGCTPRKSWKEFNIPTGVKVRHFIRGYFDGDGGCRVDKRGNLVANFCGNKKLLNEVKATLGIGGSIFKHFGIWRLVYHGNKQCSKLYHYLYDGAPVFLERKKLIFESKIL